MIKQVTRTTLWAMVGVLFGVLAAVTLQPSHSDAPPAQIVLRLRKSLSPDENAVVMVSRGRVVEVTRDAEKQRYVPPEGRVEVRVKKNGGHTTVVKSRGFTLSPGAGIAVLDVPVAVLDAKLMYWERWGLVAGIPVNSDYWYHPYAAVSYQVYNNTSLFLGPVVGGRVIAGARISF